MADRIKGITVKIGGDTTNLSKSLEAVNKDIRNTQSQLRDVNNLLKLDPTNTELLSQKQRLLKDAISETKEKLQALKIANEEAAKTAGNYDAWKEKYTPIQSEIQDTAEKLKKLKKQAEEAEKQLADGNISKEKYDALQKEIEETEQKLAALKQSAKNVDEEFGRPISPEQYDALQREIIDTENKLKNLEDQAAKSRSALVKLSDVGEKMQSVGDKISDIGTKLTPLSAAASGVLVGATKAAVDFEDAFAGVKKTVDGTDEQLSTIKQGILDLSKSTASSATDIAAVSEAAGQLGIKTNDVLSFTETMVMLGDSTNLSAEEAASALAKFANITQMSADHYDNLGSVIVDLGNNFATTESDIVAMATRLASAGEITGLTEPQIMALATALSSAGIEAEAGGSAWSKLLKILNVASLSFESSQAAIDRTGYSLRDLQLMQSNSSKDFKALADSCGMTSDELSDCISNVSKLNQFAETAGMSTQEFQKAYGEDSVKALSTFITGLNDTERNGKNAVEILNDMGLTEIRLSNAILAMSSSGDLMTSAIDTANQAWVENNALQNEAEQRYATTASQISQVKATAVELCTKLGEILLPVVRDILDAIRNVIERLSALSPETQATILKVLAVIAVLGPFLTILGKVISGIGSFLQIFAKIPKALNSVKTGFTALSGALSLPTAAILAIVAAVATLVAAFVHLWNTNEDFRNNIIGIWEQIKTTFSNLTQGILDRINALGFDFGSFTEALKAAWQGLCDMLAPYFEGVFQYIADAFETISGVILGILDVFIGLFSGDWNQMWDGVKGIVSSILTGVWNKISNIFNTIKNITNVFLGWFGTSWSSLWTSVKTFFSNIWINLQTFFTNTLNNIKTFFGGIWTGISTTFHNAVTSIQTTATTIFTSVKTFITTIFQSIHDFFASIFHAIYLTVSTKIQAVYNVITTIWNAVYETIKPLLDAFAYLFETIFEAIQILIGRAMDWISEKISAVWDGIVSFLTPILEGIRDLFSSIWTTITDAIQEKLDFIKALIETIWNDIKDRINVVLNTVKALIETIWNTISGGISAVMGTIRNTISSAWDHISEKVSSALTTIQSIVSNIWESIHGKISSAMQTIESTIANIWDNIKNGVSDKIWGIKNAIVDGFNGAIDWVRGLASDAWNWGADIIGGIIDGIQYMIGYLVDAVVNVADTIRAFLHFSVPDKGPLTDFESWMPDFMQGLADGIEKSKKLVEKAMSSVAEGISVTMQSDLQYRLEDSEAMLRGTAVGGTTTIINNNDNSRTVNQTNNGLKPVSRLELFRQTRNAINV